MKVLLFVFVITTALVATAGAGERGQAAPGYQILPPASGVGYLSPANNQPYAYGWFGAQSRKTWYRHFGYYRNYTQWRAK